MGGFATSAVLSAMQYAVSDAQREAKSDVEQGASEADAAAEVAQIRQDQATERNDREARLRRALATQRAKFGAQGIGSGGSGDAALAGLAAEADKENQTDREASELRIQQINDQVAWGARKSLLDETYPRYSSAISAVRQGLSGVSLLSD